MPYALRACILNATCRVLNLVENLTRSQKINCVFSRLLPGKEAFTLVL